MELSCKHVWLDNEVGKSTNRSGARLVVATNREETRSQCQFTLKHTDISTASLDIYHTDKLKYTSSQRKSLKSNIKYSGLNVLLLDDSKYHRDGKYTINPPTNKVPIEDQRINTPDQCLADTSNSMISPHYQFPRAHWP